MDKSCFFDFPISNLLPFSNADAIPPEFDDNDLGICDEGELMGDYTSKARDYFGNSEDFLDYFSKKLARNVASHYVDCVESDLDAFVEMLQINGLIAAMVTCSFIAAGDQSKITLNGLFNSFPDLVVYPFRECLSARKQIRNNNDLFTDQGTPRLGLIALYTPVCLRKGSEMVSAKNARFRNWMSPFFAAMVFNTAAGRKGDESVQKDISIEHIPSFDQNLWHFIRTLDNPVLTDDRSVILDENERRRQRRKIADFDNLLTIVQQLTDVVEQNQDVCDQAMLAYLNEVVFHVSNLAALFERLRKIEQKNDDLQQERIRAVLSDAVEKSSYPFAFFAKDFCFRTDSAAFRRNSVALRNAYIMMVRTLIKVVFAYCGRDMASCCRLLKEYVNASASVQKYLKQRKKEIRPLPDFFNRSLYDTTQIMAAVSTEIFAYHDYFRLLPLPADINLDLALVNTDNTLRFDRSPITVQLVRGQSKDGIES